VSDRDDRRLRERVRAALERDEPRHVPAFERLWTTAAARRGPRRTVGWRAGAAVAAAALAAVAFWIAGPARDVERVAATSGAPGEVSLSTDRPPTAAAAATADRDYRLATELAAAFATPSPIDRLTASLPPTVARGLPSLSDYRYPLLPEEIPL
jgi:hypothetical protein